MAVALLLRRSPGELSAVPMFVARGACGPHLRARYRQARNRRRRAHVRLGNGAHHRIERQHHEGQEDMGHGHEGPDHVVDESKSRVGATATRSGRIDRVTASPGSTDPLGPNRQSYGIAGLTGRNAHPPNHVLANLHVADVLDNREHPSVQAVVRWTRSRRCSSGTPSPIKRATKARAGSETRRGARSG